MPDTFIPSREADLLTWTNNFSALITADPTSYGLDAVQATTLATHRDTYAMAYQAANDPGTRTPSAIVTKNDAKDTLVAYIRLLARIVQAMPTVTDTQKSDLGLTVRDVEPSPVPVPDSPPGITILSVLNRTVKIRLRDIKNPDRRGKPDGVSGASVFMYVGDDEPPADPLQWSFFGNTTKTIIDVDFPMTIDAGVKVWLTAFWFNTKAQSGPAASSVSTRFSNAMAQAA